MMCQIYSNARDPAKGRQLPVSILQGAGSSRSPETWRPSISGRRLGDGVRDQGDTRIAAADRGRLDRRVGSAALVCLHLQGAYSQHREQSMGIRLSRIPAADRDMRPAVSVSPAPGSTAASRRMPSPNGRRAARGNLTLNMSHSVVTFHVR
jgi:hypothetical protein